MSKYLELKFMQDWLQGVEAPDLTQIKSFASAMSEDTDGALTYSQSLQVAAGGWGFQSYEILKQQTDLGIAPPLKAFDLSQCISVAARLRSKKFGRTTTKTGSVTNPEYLAGLLTEIKQGVLRGNFCRGLITLCSYQTSRGTTFDLTQSALHNPLDPNWNLAVASSDHHVEIDRVVSLPTDGLLAVVQTTPSPSSEDLITIVQMHESKVHRVRTIPLSTTIC